MPSIKVGTGPLAEKIISVRRKVSYAAGVVLRRRQAILGHAVEEARDIAAQGNFQSITRSSSGRFDFAKYAKGRIGPRCISRRQRCVDVARTELIHSA